VNRAFLLAIGSFALCWRAASAQPPERTSAPQPATPFLTASFSSGVLLLKDVVDGRSGGSWDFEVARQYRVSLARPIGEGTTLGLTAGIASIPMEYRVLRPTDFSAPCPQVCQADASIWTVGATLQVVSGERWYHMLELTQASTDSPISVRKAPAKNCGPSRATVICSSLSVLAAGGPQAACSTWR
jgi:hypothetical protein